MSGAKKFLAFDIGGTKIAHALTDSRGCLLEEPQRDATPRDNDEIFRLLQEIVRRYEAETDGVAIATAGEADLDNRRIISSVGNMPKGYMDTVFEKLTSKPVYVENDANAALWGEYCCGAAKGCRNVMLVAIGTGVGVAFLVDGKLLKGKSGAAGEAHFPVNRGQVRRCTCGAWDCYEIYASGTALGLDAKEVFGDPSVTSYDVIKGIKAGDARAVKAYEIWEHDVMQGIAGLANIFDPEMVVMFGSLTEFMNFGKLQDEVNRQILSAPLVLRRAELENNAAMVGAVLGAVQKIDKEKNR